MKRKVFLWIVIGSVFTSCSFIKKNKPWRNLMQYHQTIVQTNITDSIEVNLKQLLGIDYDSIYIFNEFCSGNIEDVLGIQYNSPKEIPDSYDRIVLLKKGEILSEFDVCSRDIYFNDFTEKKDTINYSYLVYYGSLFYVTLTKDMNNHVRCIYSKKKETGIPLYFRNYLGGGVYLYNVIN